MMHKVSARFARYALSAMAVTSLTLAAAAGTASAAPPSVDQVREHLAQQGGTVTADGRWMHMPDGADVSVVPMSFNDCPGGWVCMWKDGGFSGRMVRWSSPGTRIAHLSDYGFNDEMSSWANKGSRQAAWWVDSSFRGARHAMPPGSSSAHGGNDEASSLAIY